MKKLHITEITLTAEEIELIQIAMECLYSELPEYDSINEKLRAMHSLSREKQSN